jgi:hypothetical protein
LPIDEQPEGLVYIAKQNDNPFHNFLSLYLVIQQPIRASWSRFPAGIDLDPQTGQITTTFDDLPSYPVSSMEMNLKGGLRAGLVNPQTCGMKTIEATFCSWQEPTVPIIVNSNFVSDAKPRWDPVLTKPLGDRPFEPQLAAAPSTTGRAPSARWSWRMTRYRLRSGAFGRRRAPHPRDCSPR